MEFYQETTEKPKFKDASPLNGDPSKVTSDLQTDVPHDYVINNKVPFIIPNSQEESKQTQTYLCDQLLLQQAQRDPYTLPSR